jgi:hypothetical protein
VFGVKDVLSCDITVYNPTLVGYHDKALHGPDKIKWEKAVREEHNRMLKFNVWEAVRRMDMSAATKVITSTWAMKKKAS